MNAEGQEEEEQEQEQRLGEADGRVGGNGFDQAVPAGGGQPTR